jgi:sugar phosphate isomerase/epimerase
MWMGVLVFGFEGLGKMAIEFGRSLRWYNDYAREIDFCEQNAFSFMQIWYKKGKLLIDNVEEPAEVFLKKYSFPLIIHAVFEIDEYALYGDRLIKILKYFGHDEVIIHPVFSSKVTTDETIYELAENIKRLNVKLKDNGIKLFVENNSSLEKVLHTTEDLRIFFRGNSGVELLLDLAHIGDYEHLCDIIEVKYPGMLHVSDRRFSVAHEHLPIGMGDIDFELGPVPTSKF